MKSGPKPATRILEDCNTYCEYGCGKLAKFITHSKKFICESSANKCEINRMKNSDGITQAHKDGKIPSFNSEEQERGRIIIRSNNTERSIWHRTFAPWDDIPNGAKFDRILFEQDGVCAICNCLPFHNDKPLKFQLDHILGKQFGNDRDNLRIICPNCHTQTPTYGSRNASLSGRIKMGRKGIKRNKYNTGK